MKKSDQLTPQEIITALDRSYQAMQEGSRRDTVDAAQKAFDNCQNWLRQRRIKFHQEPRGRWVLDEQTTEQGK